MKRFRIWISWKSRRIKKGLCKLGWHYWRYNTLYMGVPAGSWIRFCNDCGRWEERTYIKNKLKWYKRP